MWRWICCGKGSARFPTIRAGVPSAAAAGRKRALRSAKVSAPLVVERSLAVAAPRRKSWVVDEAERRRPRAAAIKTKIGTFGSTISTRKPAHRRLRPYLLYARLAANQFVAM